MKKKESVGGIGFSTDVSCWYNLLPGSPMAAAFSLNEIAGSNGEAGDDKYLQKEQKIYSLLRKRQPKPFRKDLILESVRADWKKTLASLSNKAGKEMRTSFLKTEEKAGFEEACQELKARFPLIRAELRLEQDDGYARRILQNCCDETIRRVVSVYIPEWDKTYYTALDGKVKKRYDRLSWTFRGEKRYIYVADFQGLFTELYIRNYVVQFFREFREESGSLGAYLERRLVCRVVHAFLDDETMYQFSEEALKLPELPYCSVPERYNNGTAAIYRMIYDNHNPKAIGEKIGIFELEKILGLMRKEYLQKKEESKMEKNLSGEYARSYQTKRNIPGKYLQAMKRSGFNDYFGYVEFDADCDLSLLPELYREYRALCKTVGIPAYKDASLRFRKLGNHHASGLYYPAFACLCVDIRSPQSMAHEVGHMIDYHCGHISEKREFMKVFDRYQLLLQTFAECTEDKTAKTQLQGNGKYNLSYYLQSTEIFARCFEMYLVREIKVDNSLCQPDGGFAYPVDEELDRLCKEFFSALLEQLKGEVEDGKEKREIS